VDSVAIVGVGLIGGSFALGLRKAGYSGRILGVSSPPTLERALALSVIDKGASLEDAARQADLIYLAQPVHGIISTLPLLAQWVKPSTLITDVGSTKKTIVDTAAVSLRPGQFLGGHPLAGKESRGVEAADAELFSGRTYVLTPAASPKTPQVVEFVSWLERIGAVPLWLDAAEHDQTLAYTSHLPQLASTALAVLLSEQGPNVNSIFGPALLDSTRLALSAFEIWADIFDTNGQQIDTALDGYIQALQRLRMVLGAPEMRACFNDAAGFARKLRTPHQ
jgi:prephenate dehydrogenase